jgi:hypothetical protein
VQDRKDVTVRRSDTRALRAPAKTLAALAAGRTQSYTTPSLFIHPSLGEPFSSFPNWERRMGAQ